MQSLYTLARQLSEAFTTDTRESGAEFTHLKDGSPEWMKDVIRAVHKEKSPDDTTYSMIERAASAIADSDGGDLEGNAKDAITEMEPDCYPARLTAWLAARADHVYYLTEVLEQFEPKDGFALLAQAQKIQMDEIGFALIRWLEDRAEQMNENENTEEA